MPVPHCCRSRTVVNVTGTMLAVSVVLFALIHGVFSVCPEILSDEKKDYPVGATLAVPCPLSSAITYIVTCRQSGLWDHSLLNTCSGQPPPPVPAITTTRRPIPPGTTRPPPPPPPTTTPMMCPYLSAYMKAEDAGKTFPQGAVYDMRCARVAGTFVATCRNNAWVYRIDACLGRPPTVRPNPTLPPVSTLPQPTAGPGNCPYLSGYMLESDEFVPMRNGAVYRMWCQRPYQDNKFDATCDNGVWYGNQASCRGGGGGLFGGLFGRQPARRPTPTRDPSSLKSCGYIKGWMSEEDATQTFPHGTEYRFKCPEQNRATRYIIAVCRDGEWYYDPNECSRRRSFLGNTRLPLWLFLLPNGLSG